MNNPANPFRVPAISLAWDGEQVIGTAAQFPIASGFNNAIVRQLARYQGQALPLAVTIGGGTGASSNSTPGGIQGGQLRHYCGNSAYVANTGIQAFIGLVLDYGSGNSTRRRILDWIPGTYRVPPSEQLEASVMACWGDTGITPFPNVTLAASIRPSPADFAGDRPTASTLVPGLTAAAAAVVDVAVPDGAIAVDLYPVDDILAPYGATQPVLQLASAGGGSAGFAPVNILRDYVSAVAFPQPGPVPIASAMQNQILEARNYGTADTAAIVVFDLEL